MEKLEMARVVEQMDHAALRLTAARPELFARQGERDEERMGKLETARVVEQTDHAALRLVAARPELFARQGAVVATWRRRPHPNPLPTNLRSVPGEGTVRTHPDPLPTNLRSVPGEETLCPHPDPLPKGEGTERYGPYDCLSYRDEGRQRSIYLGREGPLVEEVRRRLEHLQRPLQQRRALSRLRRQVATALRADKRRLDSQLRAYGLRLQGFEVRGWRTSVLRVPATPKPPPSARWHPSGVRNPPGVGRSPSGRKVSRGTNLAARRPPPATKVFGRRPPRETTDCIPALAGYNHGHSAVRVFDIPE